MWDKNFFTSPRPDSGEEWNLTGSYISLEDCVNDLLASNSRGSADKIRDALELIPLDTLATINNGKFAAIADLNSETNIDRLPIEELTNLFREIVTGMLISVYRVLEN